MTEEEYRQAALDFCKEYIHTWISAMNNERTGLLSSWHGYHLNDWTTMHMQHVLYPLAKNYDNKNGYNDDGYAISYQKEYYRVDFTMYTHFEKTCHWTLDYAIEHENDEFELDKSNNIKHKGWFDEFAKLLPLKCAKARVIISYDNFSLLGEKIKKCRDLLMCDKIQPSLADSPILLIIFPRTKYIQNGCKTGKFNDGIMRIVYFCKATNSEEWKVNDRFEKEILNEEMTRQLLCVYNKIVDTLK